MSTKALNNAVSWFEIPVRDLDRAQRFYETLLNQALRREQMGPTQMAIFPYQDGAIGGCLLQDGRTEPARQGTLVFLNAGPSLDATLRRVAEAGGRISTPRIDLPGDMGCYAHVEDCEGNRVGLHSPH